MPGKLTVLLCLMLCAHALQSQELQDTSTSSLPFHSSFPRQAPEASSYLHFLGNNLKYQALAPFKTKISKGTIYFATTIAVALLREDRRLNHELRLVKEQSSLVHKSSSFITTLGGYNGVLLLGGLGTYGAITRNRKLSTTVMLASQSYITSGIWAFILKISLGRTRPDEYNHWTGPDRIFRPQDRHLTNLNEFNSFPSSHTTTAFSIASVFARQYKNKPIVGIGAYSMATLVGLSRMTENRHWGSDIIAGGLLGYLCGTAVVRNFEKRISGTTNQASPWQRILSRTTLTPVHDAYSSSLSLRYAL